MHIDLVIYFDEAGKLICIFTLVNAAQPYLCGDRFRRLKTIPAGAAFMYPHAVTDNSSS